MEIVLSLIPEDRYFKPAAGDVAGLLKMLLMEEYIDNEEVYLDVGYDSGHHRPGASTMTSIEKAAAVLENCDDAEVTDFSIESIRGTSSVPDLFENCDHQNLSLMGWLAVRVFENAYPILDLEAERTVMCAFCGRESGQQQWSSKDDLWRCPGCGQLEEMHALDFRPPIEFARFVLEISELVFTEMPPRLERAASLIDEIGDILGCDLKPVWYRI